MEHPDAHRWERGSEGDGQTRNQSRLIEATMGVSSSVYKKQRRQSVTRCVCRVRQEVAAQGRYILLV